MIIKCPNCGFSGRIPSYALGSPHSARCPKCAFRFELRAHSLQPVPGMIAIEVGGNYSLDAPGSDPNSSAYELKAITEDFSAANGWDTSEHTPEELADEPPLQASQQIINGNPRATQASDRAIPLPSVSDLQAAPRTGTADPWYSRVLQVWAIVLLIWAAVILGRSLFLMFLPGSNGPVAGDSLISTVVSVLLLVPGAAALFLLVDFGRYIRDLQSLTRNSSVGISEQHVSSPIGLRLRQFWNRPFRAPSVGPGN